MRRQWKDILSLLAGVAGLAIATAGHAEQVVVAHLTPTSDSAAHGTVELKLALSTEKPAGITKEPAYRNTPKYGVLHIGDAKENAVYVVLDAPDDPKFLPTLYVDANGDGDLTNDAPVRLTLPPVPKPAVKKKMTATKEAKDDAQADDTPPPPKPALIGRAAVVARYKSSGAGNPVRGAIKFIYRSGELYTVSDIVRTGMLTLAQRTYHIALVDETGTGLFNSYDHDEDQPVKVHLLIDKNGDGVFNPRKEAFDAFLPFHLPTGSYQVKSIDAHGTFLTLGLASREVAGPIKPSDLKVGSDCIDFEAIAMDGKPLSFPDDYKGKVVLLTFQAFGLPESAAEIAQLAGLMNQFKDKGFDIVMIDLDLPDRDSTFAQAKQQVGQMMTQQMVTWRVIFDGAFEVALEYGIRKAPLSYLMDGTTGKVLAMNNELHGTNLQKAVMKAIDDLAKNPAP